MIQLALDLPRRTAFGRSDFMVSDSNIAAVERIDRWPDWPSAALVLHGAPGCGKTHLVHLWRERASALIVAGETLTDAMVPRLLHEVPRQTRSTMRIGPRSPLCFTFTILASSTEAAC
jgi:hypothetical protein